MYFSNIANNELQHFHKTTGADFTMSLTDILTSDLFNVETVIANEVYRIYPLFYCKDIISSNSNDKNLNNRCLIMEKNEHETYVSFTTETGKSNVLLDEGFLNVKGIGDNLTVDEFNSMVYLFREKGVITGDIDFEETNTITGQYATYVFGNVDNQLRNDTGIIINEHVKNNPITIKLQNPFFLSAKYSLTCTVRSLTGANVFEDIKENYKVVDTFTVDLLEDIDIALDLTDYANDSVLDFKIKVDISFNLPEIVNSNFVLTLSSDREFVVIGDDLLLTANLVGEGNVQGYTVKFYEDEEIIGSVVTDENGVAVFNYTPTVMANHVYSVEVFGLKTNINIAVRKLDVNLSFNVSATAYLPYGNFDVYGYLKDEFNAPVSNATVKVYMGNDVLETYTTNASGYFGNAFSKNELGTYSFYAVYDGDATHVNKTSVTKSLVVKKAPTSIQLVPDKNSYNIGETVTAKVFSNYGNITSSRMSLKADTHSPYHDLEVTKTSQGDTFEFTILPKYTSEYFEFGGNDIYQNSTKSINIGFNPVIAVLRSSKKIVVQLFDANTDILKNYCVYGVVGEMNGYIINNGVRLNLDNVIVTPTMNDYTDSNGNYMLIDFSNASKCNVTLTAYYGTKSNTITISW